MNRRAVLGTGAVLLGCLTLLAFVGCSGSGGTNPPSAAIGLTRGAPRYLPTRFAAHRATSAGGLSYFGGPVLVHPRAYVIFWGYKKYGDPDRVAKLLEEYFGVVGGSKHDAIYTQYYQVTGVKKTHVTNAKYQVGGFWFDEGNAVPQEPTDAQVATEAMNGVTKFGYDAGGSYIVATPHGRSSSGFGTQWCAYHSNTYDGSNAVSYTNLPYIPDAGANCGAGDISAPKDEKSSDEGVTIVEGEEYGASITDPIPGEGWYNEVSGEIGATCDNIQNDRFGKQFYATKAMWSNANEGCVQYYQR